jgi:hypothetical protein
MKKFCCLCFLLISSFACAATGPDARISQGSSGCFYDGKLYSEGALVNVKSTNDIAIQCEKHQPPKDGFFWKMLGVQTKAGSDTGKKQ